MPTGFETKKVIVSAGDGAMTSWAPVNLADGDGSGVRSASSLTLNLASRGSLAQSRPTIEPSIISDEDMAWLVVDAVKSCLTDYERTMVFIELGCGESYLAIKRILAVLLSNRMTLPVAILSKLTGWLNGYAGSPEEPQLRMMLAVIRLQQREAV
jgi:hypothetical protein